MLRYPLGRATSDATHLDERHGSVGVVDGLHHGLRGYQVGDALRRGQVVLRRHRGGRDLLVLKGVEQVLAAVLLVAVLDDGPQGLSPGHLWGWGGWDVSVRAWDWTNTFNRLLWDLKLPYGGILGFMRLGRQRNLTKFPVYTSCVTLQRNSIGSR